MASLDEVVGIYVEEIALEGIFGISQEKLYSVVSARPGMGSFLNAQIHCKIIEKVIQRHDVNVVHVRKDFPSCKTSTFESKEKLFEATLDFVGDVLDKKSWDPIKVPRHEADEYRLVCSYQTRLYHLGIVDPSLNLRDQGYRVLEVIGAFRYEGVYHTDVTKQFHMEAKNMFHQIKLLYKHGLIVRRKAIRSGSHTTILFLKRFSPPKDSLTEPDVLEEDEEEECAQSQQNTLIDQHLIGQIYALIYESGSKGVLQKDIAIHFGIPGKFCSSRCRYICEYFNVVAIPVIIDKQMNYRLVVKSFLESKDQSAMEEAKALSNTRLQTMNPPTETLVHASQQNISVDSTSALVHIGDASVSNLANASPQNIWKKVELKSKVSTTNFVQRRNTLLQIIENSKVELLGIQLAGRMMEQYSSDPTITTKSKPDLRTLLRVALDLQNSQHAKILNITIPHEQNKHRVARIIHHPSISIEDPIIQDFVKSLATRMRGVQSNDMKPEVERMEEMEPHDSIFNTPTPKRRRTVTADPNTSETDVADSSQPSRRKSTRNSTKEKRRPRENVSVMLEEKFGEDDGLGDGGNQDATGKSRPVQEDDKYSAIKYQKLGNTTKYTYFWSPLEDVIMLNIIGGGIALQISPAVLEQCQQAISEIDPFTKATMMKNIVLPHPHYWSHVAKHTGKSISECQERFESVVKFPTFKRELIARIVEYHKRLSSNTKLSTDSKLDIRDLSSVIEKFDFKPPRYQYKEEFCDRKANIYNSFMAILGCPVEIYTPEIAEDLLVHFSNEENTDMLRILTNSKTVVKEKMKSTSRPLNFTARYRNIFTSYLPFPEDMLLKMRQYLETNGIHQAGSVIQPFLNAGVLASVLSHHSTGQIHLRIENARKSDPRQEFQADSHLTGDEDGDENITKFEDNTKITVLKRQRTRDDSFSTFLMDSESASLSGNTGNAQSSESSVERTTSLNASAEKCELIRSKIHRWNLNNPNSQGYFETGCQLMREFIEVENRSLSRNPDITEKVSVLLFESIFSTKKDGISFDYEKGKALSEILTLLLESWMVVRVHGSTQYRYFVTPFASSHLIPHKNVSPDVHEPRKPIVVHPWISLDGTVNRAMVSEIYDKIIVILMTHPGIELTSLAIHFPFFCLCDLKHVLSAMESRGLIQEIRRPKQPPCTLFSSPNSNTHIPQGKRETATNSFYVPTGKLHASDFIL